MAEALVRYEVVDGIATLTLDRREKRNALNGALIAALKDALDRAGSDEEVRVVAIRGEGPDFCAGLDLAELERIMSMGAEENLAEARSLGDLFLRMRAHPRPLVAVVHGYALGGGCGIATACDLILAHEGAIFGYPEVHLGFVPALVMTILRRKVSEGRAFELAARGHRFPASEAERIGLANQVFPAGSFEEDVRDYLADLAARPPSSVTMTKRLLHELDGLGFEEGIDRAAEINAAARRTEACRDGVRRFLERRSAKS